MTAAPKWVRAISSPRERTIARFMDKVSRCYRLLQAVPELRAALPLVAEVCPKWRPIVERWGDIEAAYLRDLSERPVFEEVSNGRGRRKTQRQVNQRACYDLISSLRDACMEAAGWQKDGPGCWSKRKEPTHAA